jgi:hypothetical protein
VGDEVSNEISVFLCVLDDTKFEGAEQIERQPVLEGFLAEQNVSLEELRAIGSLGVPITVNSSSS